MSKIDLAARNTALVIGAALLPFVPASAHDLPVKGNRVAQTVMEIERGVYAASDSDMARFKIFSIFANKLAVPRGPKAVLDSVLEKSAPASALPG